MISEKDFFETVKALTELISKKNDEIEWRNYSIKTLEEKIQNLENQMKEGGIETYKKICDEQQKMLDDILKSDSKIESEVI